MLVPCACGKCNEKYDMTPGTQRFMNRRGYWMVICRHHPRAYNGYIAEHILIKEKGLPLGVYLDPKINHIHHKDRNKQNNNPKNLQIVRPGYHMKIHFPKKFIKKPIPQSRPTYLMVDGEPRKNGVLSTESGIWKVKTQITTSEHK